MALLETLNSDVKAAMKSGDKVRLATIRTVSYTHLTLPTNREV